LEIGHEAAGQPPDAALAPAVRAPRTAALRDAALLCARSLMKATGMFFLRMHASVAMDPAGNRLGVLLPVVERDANDHRVILNQLLVKWKGAVALAFFDQHQPELRAGRPLHLELDRLRGQDGEWQAQATRCELAPLAPSWKANAAQGETAERAV
jgi:hypothetical protein